MKLNRTKYPTHTIMAWLWSHHKGCRLQMSINMLTGLMGVVASLAGVEVLRRLTDMACGRTEGSFLWMSVIYVGVMLVEFLCNVTHTWLAAVLGVKAQNTLQQQFFRRLLDGRWEGIERYHSGDVINRLFGDVNDIVNLLSETLPFAVTITVQFIASFVYLLFMDPILAYIIVIVSPIFLILSRIYFRKMRRIVRKIKDTNSSLQSIIQESIQHKMVIKVMQMTAEMVHRLEHRQSLLRWQIKHRARFSILTRTIVFIGFRGSALVALIYGLWQLHEGAITFGILIAFTQLISRIQHPLLDMGRLLPTIVNSFTSSERLMELEALPLEENDTHHEEVPGSASIGVRFRDVSYRYTDGQRWILQHFNFDFQPGTITAILGETGAGKTTLLRLMLSLINPTEGTVSLYSNSDDNSETLVNPSLRHYFSYVPQGNTLFSGTIRENLKLGKSNATTEEMTEALRRAKAEFVMGLPQRLDTVIGEHGGGLSEGQAQRIAIARALLRPCSILLLDEATSALDVETEESILQNLQQHFTDTTVILVTHRPTAVMFAQNQVKMERTV